MSVFPVKLSNSTENKKTELRAKYKILTNKVPMIKENGIFLLGFSIFSEKQIDAFQPEQAKQTQTKEMANSELNINLKSFTPLLKGLKTIELL